jgi:hypothetical protein
MLKKCLFCGEEFEYTNPRQVYCSALCAGRSTAKRYNQIKKYATEKICPCCNNKFIDIGRKGKKYCSKECRYKMKSVNNEIRKCKHCGKEFTITPYVAKKRKAEYCSIVCRNKSIKKGKGHGYQYLKLTCLECGKEFKARPGIKGFCSRECVNKNIRKREKWGAERQKIKVICQICGIEFEAFPSQIEKDGCKYCSKKCAGENKTLESIVIMTCECCGKEFKVKNGGKNNGDGALRKYCGKKCQAKASMNGENRYCLNCGKEFYATPCRASNKKNGGKLCSVECKKEYYRGENSWTWEGGITPISIFVRRTIRKWSCQVKKENNYMCFISGEKGGELISHHIIPFHIIRNDILNELEIDIKKNSGDLSTEQYNAVVKKITEIHTVNLGRVIKKELHTKFHQIYGSKATYEDLLEFKQRYKNGEFINLAS